MLLPILPTIYLLGVLAPDVFLRVGFYLTETTLEGFILKESILEFDCSILLWIKSALIPLTLPKECFEVLSS